MMNRRGLLLGGTALAVTFSGAAFAMRNSQDTRTGDEVVAWLKANALPLATAEPGSEMHDLEPMRAIIGNARIVSLGEATHGTREFFQLKHRLMECCVSQLGFTIIAFEADYGATLTVNDYVLHGKGTAADVVAGMGFQIWDTEEVVALVEWVRAWNLANERKVKFYGFDMQSAAAATLHLLAYLERVAPELADASARDLAPLAARYTRELPLLPEEMQQRTAAGIKTVLEAFATERARWIERAGQLEWNLARQSALVVGQFARALEIDRGGDFEELFTFRDRSMAGNVRALLDAEGPNAKAVLWAHNGHVQRSAYFGMLNMGSILHAAFGHEHVVVGFAFNQGGFQAVGSDNKLGAHVVGPAPAGFLDAALAATGVPLFALDLTRVPADGPVAKWMASKPLRRSIGAEFIPEREREGVIAADPRDCYDVLVFVERTSAARGNPRPVFSAPIWVTEANKEPTNLALAGSNGNPDGWHPTNSSHYAYAVSVADEASPRGGRAVRIARAQSRLPSGDGALTQSFPAAPWRGRRLVFSAAIRSEARRIGTGAQLLVHVWPQPKQGGPMPIMALQADGPVRMPEWTRQSVAVDIPVEAERIQISLVVTGNGAGWFGDLELGASGPVQAVTGGFTHRQQATGAVPATCFPNSAPWSLSPWR